MDPIDSVSTGLVDDENRDLATIVDDLRNAYLTDAPLRRGPELVEFLATTTAAVGAGSPRRGLRVVGAVTAGVAGKLFIGAAVAAASVAGLQASGAIDLPGLPGPAASPQEEVGEQLPASTTVTVEGELLDDAETEVGEGGESTAVGPADAADQGQATAANAQGQRERAAELAAAREQWQACTDAATDDESLAACGPRPHPRDFGITEPPTDRPDQAGPPAHAGPPANSGPPAEAGPPANSGPPAEAGPPVQPGPPSQPGPPADTGRPEDPGGNGNGNGNG